MKIGASLDALQRTPTDQAYFGTVVSGRLQQLVERPWLAGVPPLGFQHSHRLIEIAGREIPKAFDAFITPSDGEVLHKPSFIGINLTDFRAQLGELLLAQGRAAHDRPLRLSLTSGVGAGFPAAVMTLPTRSTAARCTSV
jgi:hypothetical protein